MNITPVIDSLRMFHDEDSVWSNNRSGRGLFLDCIKAAESWQAGDVSEDHLRAVAGIIQTDKAVRESGPLGVYRAPHLLSALLYERLGDHNKAAAYLRCATK